MKPKFRSRPPVNDVNVLFKKIQQICHTKIHNISGALDVLSRSLEKPEIPSSKCIYLASKISSYDNEQSLVWVDEVIKHFLAAADSDSEWFKEKQSGLFLFAYNISVRTHRESQLRIISDYVLAKRKPKNVAQLAEHLKIASVLVQQHKSRTDVFPSGPVYLIHSILVTPQIYPFEIPKSLTDTAIRLLEALRYNESVSLIFPEICSEIEKLPETQKLHDIAAVLTNKRVDDYKSQRIYPPMIQMIHPLLTAKTLTEEQKLKKQLKKEKHKTKREIEQARKILQRDMLQRKAERKEKKDAERRKVIAMLESERTYDLNMAAAPPAEDEEEEEQNDEDLNEASNPKKYDEGLDDDDDDDDEDDDEDDDDDDTSDSDE